MVNGIVIAYYTPDYRDYALKLIESCNEYGISNDICQIPDKGSWDANTHYKPFFIKEKLREYKQGLWYVDVDAVFNDVPTLFQEIDSFDIDIAYHPHMNIRHPELLSGTLYLNDTPTMYKILNKWCEFCETVDKTYEQYKLEKALKKFPEAKVYKLPQTYCRIFDVRKIGTDKDVIIHKQASRTMKK